VAQLEFIFIVGPERSGTTLLASLLDGHPDILVWPYEWHVFTWFWSGIPGERYRKTVSAVNRQAEQMFSRFKSGVYETIYHKLLTGNSIDVGRFYALLEKDAERHVTPREYLEHVAKAFQQSRTSYGGRAIRYFLVKTMLTGIDWFSAERVHKDKMLFTLRRAKESYQSSKAKLVEKKHKRIGNYYRDNLYYQLAMAKYARDVYEMAKDHTNILFITLEAIKRAPEQTMRRITDFLGVPFVESLIVPTFVDQPFSGHFHNAQYNVGKILNKSTAYRRLLSFEDYYLDQFELPIFAKDNVSEQKNMLGRIGLILKSVFGEKDTEDTKECSSLWMNNLRKAIAFYHFVSADLKLTRIVNKDISKTHFFAKYKKGL